MDSGAGMTQAVLKELEYSKPSLDAVDMVHNCKENGME